MSHTLSSHSSCVDGRGDWSSDGCQTMGFCDTGEVMCACDHLTSFAVLNVSPLLDSLALPIQALPIQALSIQALPIQALPIHRYAHVSSISHSSLTEVVNKVHYSLPSMQEPNGNAFLSRYIYHSCYPPSFSSCPSSLQVDAEEQTSGPPPYFTVHLAAIIVPVIVVVLVVLAVAGAAILYVVYR